PVLEIHPQRDQRKAVCFDLAAQVADLRPVEQQTARPAWFVAEVGGGLVRRNVSAKEPEVAVLGAHIRLLQTDLPAAYRFDLAAGQRDSGLQATQDLVIMLRLPVNGDVL